MAERALFIDLFQTISEDDKRTLLIFGVFTTDEVTCIAPVWLTESCVTVESTYRLLVAPILSLSCKLAVLSGECSDLAVSAITDDSFPRLFEGYEENEEVAAYNVVGTISSGW